MLASRNRQLVLGVLIHPMVANVLRFFHAQKNSPLTTAQAIKLFWIHQSMKWQTICWNNSTVRPQGTVKRERTALLARVLLHALGAQPVGNVSILMAFLMHQANAVTCGTEINVSLVVSMRFFYNIFFTLTHILNIFGIFCSLHHVENSFMRLATMKIRFDQFTIEIDV